MARQFVALQPAAASSTGRGPAAADTAAIRPQFGLRLALRADRRSVRVALLTLGIGLMSLADLYITLTYLRTVGMGEGNPIARYVIEHGSPGLLVFWKCASVACACLIFLKYRRRAVAEVAAWLGFGVLVWLLLQWIAYADEAWRLTPALHVLSDAEPALWVRMPE